MADSNTTAFLDLLFLCVNIALRSAVSPATSARSLALEALPSVRLWKIRWALKGVRVNVAMLAANRVGAGRCVRLQRVRQLGCWLSRNNSLIF